MTTHEIVEQVCKDLPVGYVMSLQMENGAAWIELHNDMGFRIDLPDSADRTIAEQLEDALKTVTGG